MERGVKKEVFDPGPPMAQRLGMSEDWSVTAWHFERDEWVHFIVKKLRKRYEVFELSFRLNKLIPFLSKPVQTVDEAVDRIDESLAPEDDGEDDDELELDEELDEEGEDTSP
jgi:hypothetical protein